VGEAVSIPLLRGAWHAARHPLPRAVLGRIVRDEAAHGTFGFFFLDWALPQLSAEERAHVGRAAEIAIDAVQRVWRRAAADRRAAPENESDALAWLGTDSYSSTAEHALQTRVLAPLKARGVLTRP
jgi:hypothetical protein